MSKLWIVLILAACNTDAAPSDTDAGTDSSTDTSTDSGTDSGTGTDTDSEGWPAEPAACGVWAEGTRDADDGATRDFYNRAAGLRWREQLGDWTDKNDVVQGTDAFAVSAVVDNNTPDWQSWDVTELVQGWADGTWPNKGMLLTSPPGPFVFASRDHSDPSLRPVLEVKVGAETLMLSPVADTYVDPSTYQGFGDAPTLRIGRGANSMVRFDLRDLDGEAIANAQLRLYKLEDYGGRTIDVGVFRSSQGREREATAPKMGLAADYPGDSGIQDHDAVYLFSDFEGGDWTEDWTSGFERSTIQRIDESEGNLFQPLDGAALRVQVTAGDNYGGSLIYGFQAETGSEPTEAYFRYYLRFGEDWLPTEGGKLPGISGTYGVAGWGGRRVDGTDGWSARGTYKTVIPAGNPLQGHSAIGNYVYHADMKGQYGDVDLWLDGCAGLLNKNRWYSVETYVKLNTLGENDGVLRGWIDGRLAYERTDWRWRDVDKLKIERIWMNVYHGGRGVPDDNIHLYMDNVVIASQYIGPMKGGSGR